MTNNISDLRTCRLQRVGEDIYSFIFDAGEGPVTIGTFSLSAEQPNGIWDQYGYRVEGKEIKYGPKEK